MIKWCLCCLYVCLQFAIKKKRVEDDEEEEEAVKKTQSLAVRDLGQHYACPNYHHTVHCILSMLAEVCGLFASANRKNASLLAC